MSETVEKQPRITDNSTITDLNMLVGNMIIAGKSKVQVAKELGITSATVSHHVKRLRELTESNDDRVNSHRTRLIGKLSKTERVIDHALRPKVFKQSATYLGIAKDVSLNLLKGLGVLVERTAPATVNIEDKRIQVIAKLDMADQFGAAIPSEVRQEIQAEVIEERPGEPVTAVKQDDNSDPTANQDKPDTTDMT